MKTFKIITIFSLILAGVVGFLPIQPVNAQFYMTQSGTTSSGSQTQNQSPACVQLSSNLSYGSRDYSANGEVSKLQHFLVSQGLLRVYGSYGFYGPATFSAVRQFQLSNSISPVGIVGPVTRARIMTVSCGSVQPVPPPVPNYGTPVITAITPTSGPVGTVVTVYGSGFDAKNTVVFGNSGAVPNVVSSNGNSLTFTVPDSLTPACYYSTPACYIAMSIRQTTPGVYTVAVSNSKGTSNSFNYTVTSGTVTNPESAPVITGVDAPTNLNIGESGRWFIRALDPSGQGLSYNVTWGDENAYGSGYYVPYTGYFTQSSTFTHTYNRGGTYTPKFTVRTQNGKTAETSVTVNVGAVSQNQTPTITSLSPSSGPFGTIVTIYGSGFDGYNNSINFAGTNRVAANVSSNTGTTLQFRIPITPCTEGYACAQVALQAGRYPITVTNMSSNQTSNTMYFNATDDSSGTGNGGAVDSSVTVGLNQTVKVGDIEITPTSIVEDSRCPVNVNCIQAGRVVVGTTLKGKYNQINTNLQYGAANSSSESVLEGYTVRITDIQPVKYSANTIAYYQYRITYRVTK